MFRHFAPVIMVSITLAACSQFPQLDETVDSQARRAAYPDLIPIEDIYTRIPDTRIYPDTPLRLEDRVSRLRARAARLRGTVIDGATRQRMRAGVN